jgi:hypothetical protein
MIRAYWKYDGGDDSGDVHKRSNPKPIAPNKTVVSKVPISRHVPTEKATKSPREKRK